MTHTSAFTADSIAGHAVCAAAGVRDGLRAAQFYARDLANAGRKGRIDPWQAPFLSRFVGFVARCVDQFLSWGGGALISVLLPGWRKLPSPFAPGVIQDVATAIRGNSFRHNPRFNAYFFRAANHILDRYCERPNLVLEHRVDAARRYLAGLDANPVDSSVFLPRTLIALVRHGAVARIGAVKSNHPFFGAVDPNVAVFAIAAVALLFAAEGKPSITMAEDEFFEVTGALIGPRLNRLSQLIAAGDEVALAGELSAIKSMY
jgi:hypothetical protein